MPKRALYAALTLALTAAPAFSQSYRDAGGSIVPGVVPLPYQFTPLAPGQHNILTATATALSVPPGARYATVCASGAAVLYTTDGATTPTASVGQPLASGACVALSGPLVLANFRALSSAGTLDVEYFQ